MTVHPPTSGGVFVSSTIPYVNSRPHLGHALEYAQVDAIARHARQAGHDVVAVTGSDENSLKNVLAAEAAGVTTRDLVDGNVVHFRDLLDLMDVRVDRWIRTSVDEDHLNGAVEIWRRMAKSGDIYSRIYDGLYCVGCEQFYGEDELVDGKCPEHLVPPDLVSERNYFFRLSRYQDQVEEAISSGVVRIVPESRRNEVLRFVRDGLKDISISRSVERARGWGIPVPEDPSQVMYVWIDALTNYINALGFVRDDESYHRYWAGAAERVHVVGKGVIRFHAVYWPAMLMSAGLPLPTEVVVHGYITLFGQKLSKSSNNVVDPSALVRRYGVDAVRYFLLADCSAFMDNDYSDARLVERYNKDLANGLGNLLSRAASMVIRYRDGRVPEPGPEGGAEREFTAGLATSVAESQAAMRERNPREALMRTWDLVRSTNAYVNECAPWHLAKSDVPDDRVRLDTCLHHTIAAIGQIGRLIAPFLPLAAQSILSAVSEPDAAAAPDAATWAVGVAGRQVAKPPVLFPRIESFDEDAEEGDGS